MGAVYQAGLEGQGHHSFPPAPCHTSILSGYVGVDTGSIGILRRDVWAVFVWFAVLFM